VRVRFLGTAAGGGIPQWNCGCPGCDAARIAGFNRTQDTLAVSGDGAAWYLVNASPDLRAQLLATPELAPRPGTRATPIRGVLLSTAELDHVLGLPTLREAERLDVSASATVLAGLRPVRTLLAAYCDVHWHPLVDGQPYPMTGGLEVTRWTIGSKRPRYAAAAEGEEWVSALDIVDGAGRRLLYATCVARWTDQLAELIDAADIVVLDGTFVTEHELAQATGRGVPASAMGHLPIEGSLAVARPSGNVIYSHLNNTNPLTGPRAILHFGHAVEIARDGLTVEL
jgi:pyrroloquinoline quinone biosynthesis protein B